MSDERPRNRVVLNIGMNGAESPEPGIAAVMIDGVPIHNLTAISVNAGVGQYTHVALSFHCEVDGFVAGNDVGDIIRKGA